MNEREFREQYAALQERTAVSSELKKQTAARVRNASRTAAPRARVAVARRWALPAAACLVAAAVVAGGVPVVMSAFNSDGTENAAVSEAARLSGFSVRAYASDGSSILALGDDGRIIFDRDMSNGFPVNEYTTEGYYTGCLFRVEGEGIARVQMNVSRGQLYRSTVERFKRGEEPEKWREALNWKPTKRGMGTYYGLYDQVQPIGSNDGLPKDSPDKQVGVSLAKKLGSTIDVSAADDPGIATGDTSFGLWTNDPFGGGDPFSAVIDLFDGQTLTVTVTFEDGHTSTQVIELHAADMRAELGPEGSQVLPELVDLSTVENPEEVTYLHSLYGTVVEANENAFPLSLEGANALEGTVDPAMVLPRREPIEQPFGSVDNMSLVNLGETATISESVGEFNDDPTLAFDLTLTAASRTKTLPEGIDLASTDIGDDVAYANQSSEQVFGYQVNEDGTISGNYSFVVLEMTIANTRDTAENKNTFSLGNLAVVKDGGIASSAQHRTFYASIWDGSDGLGNVELAAGETRTVTVVMIASDSLLDDPSLMLVTGESPDHTATGLTGFVIGALQ